MSRFHSFFLKALFVSIIVLLIICSISAIYRFQRAAVGDAVREKEREIIQAEITDLIVRYQNGETQTIDLFKLSSFTWERLYIFGPNQKLKYIQKELGSSWRPDRTYAPPRPYTYLVFTLNGEVVQYVEYPISESVSFAEAAYKIDGYALEEARFRLNRQGYVVWFYK